MYHDMNMTILNLICFCVFSYAARGFLSANIFQPVLLVVPEWLRYVLIRYSFDNPGSSFFISRLFILVRAFRGSYSRILELRQIQSDAFKRSTLLKKIFQ